MGTLEFIAGSEFVKDVGLEGSVGYCTERCHRQLFVQASVLVTTDKVEPLAAARLHERAAELQITTHKVDRGADVYGPRLH